MAAVRLLELRFLSDPDRLRSVRETVKDIARANGCGDKLAADLVIAVNEACMNIMQHAYKGDVNGQIVLEVLRVGQVLEFRLRDFAAPADLDQIRPRDLADVRPGGLGTHFIRAIMDDCEYAHAERGNVLRMRKKIS